MQSALRFFGAFLCLLLSACGGGGSLDQNTDTGGTSDPSGTVSVALTISNPNIAAATPATLTATVTNSLSGAVAGELVTFELDNTALGSFQPALGTALTDENGVATVSLATLDVAGAGQVTASISSGESAVVGFSMAGDGGASTGTDNQLVLALSDSNGNAITQISNVIPGTVTATYTDNNGEPITNRVVSFTSDLGVFSPTSGTALTNQQGIATITLNAGFTSGASSINAIVDGVSATPLGFTTLGDEVEPRPIDEYLLSLVVENSNGDSIRNIGYTSPGTAIATLTQNGAPAAYQRIAFDIEGNGLLNPTSGEALTNANGQAVVTILTGQVPGAGTVNASFVLDGDTLTDSYNYQVAGDAPGGDGEVYSLSIAMTSSVSGTPTSQVSLAEPAKLTATLTDSSDEPVSGAVVQFSSSLGNFLPNTGTALTDALGNASITLTAGSVQGAGSATVNFSGVQAQVGFVSAGDEIAQQDAAPEVSFEFYDCNDAAGWDKELRNFEVCTITNNITNERPAIIGITVTREGTGQFLRQMLVSASTTLGSISPDSGTAITNDEGRAALDLYSNGAVGAGEASVRVNDVSATKAFEIGRTNISLDLTADIGSRSLPAGGSTILEATVFNSDGSLATDQSFSLSFSSECSVAGRAEIDSPVLTNAGKAYATYRSNGCETQDRITVTALSGGSSVSQTLNINIDAVSVGSLQYISSSPTSLALLGSGGISGSGARSETSTVSFRLLDETAAPAGQETVCFELSTDTGGMSLSPAPLAEDFLTCPNFPKPGDAEYPVDLSLPNKYAVARTNINGDVSVTVRSGNKPTPVKVFAMWADSNPTSGNISNTSDELVVTTGLADFDSFSVAADVYNPEAWNHDGEEVNFTVRAADHFNNMVPAGTRVVFRAEGGSIQASCETGGGDNPDGTCSVVWRSQDSRPFASTPVVCPIASEQPPCVGTSWASFIDGTNSVIAQPRPGRATITAYAIGEESFVDLNGNGQFDSGEPFDDRSEAFYDHNEDGYYRQYSVDGSISDLASVPAGAAGEEPIDFNNNNVFDKADGKYTGLLCADDAQADCTNTGNDNAYAQLNVYRNLPIVMSGSTPYVRLMRIGADGDTLSTVSSIDLYDRTDPANPIYRGAQTVYLFVSDLNNNTLPYDTSIDTSIDNGKLVAPTSGSYTVNSNSSNRALVYGFTIGEEDTPNQRTSGSMVITVTTPLGQPVSVVLTVNDNG